MEIKWMPSLMHQIKIHGLEQVTYKFEHSATPEYPYKTDGCIVRTCKSKNELVFVEKNIGGSDISITAPTHFPTLVWFEHRKIHFWNCLVWESKLNTIANMERKTQGSVILCFAPCEMIYEFLETDKQICFLNSDKFHNILNFSLVWQNMTSTLACVSLNFFCKMIRILHF